MSSTEKLVFEDEYGNMMEAKLESFENGTEDENETRFLGYLVAIIGAEPYVGDYSEKDKDAYFMAKDKATKKMEGSINKFYQEHPEELKVALDRRASEEAYRADPDRYKTDLLYHYRKRQAEKFIQGCVEKGQATHMMLIYDDQMKNIANNIDKFYSWEQITGKQPLDAPQEEVQQNIKTEEQMRADAVDYNKKLRVIEAANKLRSRPQIDKQDNHTEEQSTNSSNRKDYKGTSLPLPPKGYDGYD